MKELLKIIFAIMAIPLILALILAVVILFIPDMGIENRIRGCITEIEDKAFCLELYKK